MKSSVASVIHELKEACHRSLYNGNDLNLGEPRGKHSHNHHHFYRESSSGKRQRQDETIQWRSWEVILSDAAVLLPRMTEEEHGQISRLTSILLLGFLLPRSTGNEFFLLQNMSSRTYQHRSRQTTTGSSMAEQSSSTDNRNEDTLWLPLDERLASIPHEYSGDSFGDVHSIVDERFDATFQSFLQKGLIPLLSARPAHTRQVDHLHVIAMAIHPHPSEQPLRATITALKGRYPDDDGGGGGGHVWAKTRALMSSMVPHNFHLNYWHRRLLTRIVAEHLVLPTYDEDQAFIDAPLFDGALPHLRASLYAFGMASISPYDAHWAHCGMVSIAVQTGQKVVIREEWGRLLNRLMEDRTHYESCQVKAKPVISLSFMTEKEESFCPHRARGRLLSIFLSRLGQARHCADVDFIHHALSSLSDATEFKVDSWTKEDDEQSATREPPCALASLLVAAQSLFFFLLPLHPQQDGEEEPDEVQYRDMLLSCGIQLLHHWDNEIASEASNLLAKAFCYGPDRIVNDYAEAVFSSIKVAIDNILNQTNDDDAADIAITGIIALVSRKCRSIGEAILKYVTSLDRMEPQKAHIIDRLIASVSCASPSVGDMYTERITDLLDRKTTTERSKKQLFASLMGTRRSCFFNRPSDSDMEYVEKMISTGATGWDLYFLGRQALVSGCYLRGCAIFEELSCMARSEYNYLWLSSLQKIATAESQLLEAGAMGIPGASIELFSAASTIQSLPSFLDTTATDFEFHLRFVKLRLDFLDLVCSIRQLASEMRLTSVGPKKVTRSNLHLTSAVKLLNVLGTSYLSLYRQYGLFACQQSRTSLRTLHALCRFASRATQSTFIDTLPDLENVQQNAILALTLPQGDASHPLAILMGRLDSQILNDMSGSVDAKIRATALLQVIDGVLKVPSPFPRSFFRTRPIERTEYRLYVETETLDDQTEAYDDVEDEINLPVGSLVTLVASGNLTESFMKSVDLPFYTIILWHTVEKDEGTSEDEDKSVVRETSSSLRFSVPSTENPGPINALSFSPSGRFFFRFECENLFWQPGIYRIETCLGCRDVRGGEWELPIDGHSRPSISLRMNRP